MEKSGSLLPVHRMPIYAAQKRGPTLLLGCMVLFLFLISATQLKSLSNLPNWEQNRLQVAQGHDLTASNSTLGFETIIAISSENQKDPKAWRQKGLERAAMRTGLQISIPRQRQVSMDEVNAMREGGENDWRPNEGQARAWLAHLDILQYIIDNNITTALIVEDDADWDVSLRTQITPIAAAVRTLTQASNPSSQFPYGTSWDLLWLGHCGSEPARPNSSPIYIQDSSVLPIPLIRAAFDSHSSLPDQTRSVEYSTGPLCTFAYAITLESARKLHIYMSQPDEAYDVRMHHGCGNGNIDCVVVVPEVMHHQRAVGTVSLSRTKAQLTRKFKDDGMRKFTHNIRNSARCNWNRPDGALVQCLPTEREWLDGFS